MDNRATPRELIKTTLQTLRQANGVNPLPKPVEVHNGRISFISKNENLQGFSSVSTTTESKSFAGSSLQSQGSAYGKIHRRKIVGSANALQNTSSGKLPSSTPMPLSNATNRKAMHGITEETPRGLIRGFLTHGTKLGRETSETFPHLATASKRDHPQNKPAILPVGETPRAMIRGMLSAAVVVPRQRGRTPPVRTPVITPHTHETSTKPPLSISNRSGDKVVSSTDVVVDSTTSNIPSSDSSVSKLQPVQMLSVGRPQAKVDVERVENDSSSHATASFATDDAESYHDFNYDDDYDDKNIKEDDSFRAESVQRHSETENRIHQRAQSSEILASKVVPLVNASTLEKQPSFATGPALSTPAIRSNEKSKILSVPTPSLLPDTTLLIANSLRKRKNETPFQIQPGLPSIRDASSVMRQHKAAILRDHKSMMRLLERQNAVNKKQKKEIVMVGGTSNNGDDTAKSVVTSFEDAPQPPLKDLKRMFTAFLQSQNGVNRCTPEALNRLHQLSNQFFAQIAGDLSTYTRHGNRKRTKVKDVELLLRRQRKINKTMSFENLVRAHLSREIADAIMEQQETSS